MRTGGGKGLASSGMSFLEMRGEVFLLFLSKCPLSIYFYLIFFLFLFFSFFFFSFLFFSFLSFLFFSSFFFLFFLACLIVFFLSHFLFRRKDQKSVSISLLIFFRFLISQVVKFDKHTIPATLTTKQRNEIQENDEESFLGKLCEKSSFHGVRYCFLMLGFHSPSCLFFFLPLFLTISLREKYIKEREREGAREEGGSLGPQPNN